MVYVPLCKDILKIYCRSCLRRDVTVTCLYDKLCQLFCAKLHVFDYVFVDPELHCYREATSCWMFEYPTMLRQPFYPSSTGTYFTTSRNLRGRAICTDGVSGSVLLGNFTGECPGNPEVCPNGFVLAMWLKLYQLPLGVHFGYVVSLGAENNGRLSFMVTVQISKENCSYFLPITQLSLGVARTSTCKRQIMLCSLRKHEGIWNGLFECRYASLKRGAVKGSFSRQAATRISTCRYTHLFLSSLPCGNFFLL